jgi:hypothetical protein
MVVLQQKKLKELGYYYRKMKVLINIGILKREKRGIYVLENVHDLYIYGTKLIKNGEH